MNPAVADRLDQADDNSLSTHKASFSPVDRFDLRIPFFERIDLLPIRPRRRSRSVNVDRNRGVSRD
jgi:hypothetical protein